MTTLTKLLTLTAMIGALTLQQASAIVTAVDLGTGLPPGTLGGYTVNPYDPGSITGADYYAHLTGGNDDGTGIGTWLTWGQAYTGNVYVSLDGAKPLTLTLSGDVGAVYFYMEPNVWSDFLMTATDSSGVSVSTVINGYHGSSGVGFYAGAGQFLTSISVVCSDPSGFAIGEFGIDNGTLHGDIGTVPDAGSSLALLGLAFAALGGARRHFKA